MVMDFVINEDEDMLEELCDAYVLISNSRYLNNRVRSPRSQEFLLNCALNLNATEFQQNFRCYLESFLCLVELLRSCPVFHNHSTCPQTAVTWQVCIAFWRLGHNGNGAATVMQSMLFGFGIGTIVLFTNRVSRHYCRLEVGTFYGLVKKEEGRSDRSWMQRAFQDVWVLLTGLSFLYLRSQPSMGSVTGTTSIDVPSICKLCGTLIDVSLGFLAGWPGSMHDAGLWRKSAQAKNPKTFFSKGEYIIGDSAYGLSSYLIRAFKSLAADIQVNKEFNYVLGKSRVRNEYSIAILKGRWSCLREYRRQIRSARDVQAIIRVSSACVILHNMLANLGDSWAEMFREVNPVEVSVAESMEGSEVERATTFREEVKIYAVEKGYSNGVLPISH